MSMLVANCMITNLAAFFLFFFHTATTYLNLGHYINAIYESPQCLHVFICNPCRDSYTLWVFREKNNQPVKKLMLFINIYFLLRWYKLKLEIIKKLLDSYIFRQIKLMSWGRILSKQAANTAIPCSILKKLDQKITM